MLCKTNMPVASLANSLAMDCVQVHQWFTTSFQVSLQQVIWRMFYMLL